VPGVRRWTLALLLTAGSSFFGGAATARVDLCGAVIVADFTLDEDLTCAGNALIAGADGITINLKQHTITGNGTGSGLVVSGRAGIGVKGGTFVNFMAGILVTASADVDVKDATFQDNTDGIDLQAGSIGVTIKDNTFLNNRARGIMNRSGTSGNVIKDNFFHGNRVGVLLFGPTGITVKGNYISASTQFGIRVNFPATGNIVKGNTVTANPIGIDFIPNPVGGAGAVGNSFIENVISANGCGLSGPAGGNRFLENQLIGNTVDVCGT
jgi:parallel beta-helix repeat protein